MTSTTLADGAEQTGGPAPRFPDRSFRALWTATGLSQVGSAVSNVTIPVCAAVTLDATAGQMTLLAAVELVPSLLIRIPAAAWSDGLRRPRAPLMALCNLVQAAVMACVPLLWWLGALSIGLLLVLGAAASAALGVYAALSSPLLVQVVPKAHLVDANGKMSATRSVADISGPALGGALMARIAAPYVVLADALSFLASAVLLARIRPRPHDRAVDHGGATADSGADPGAGASRPKPPRPGRRANLRLAWALARQSGVRVAVTVAFVNGLVQPVIVLFLVRTAHMRPSTIGVLLSFGAIGGVTGGLLVGRVQKALGGGRTVALGALASVLSLAVLPFAAPGPVAAAGLVLLELGGSFGGTLLIATVFGALQSAAPPDRIAQVMATAMVQLQAASLLGVPAGGALAVAFGPRTAMVAAAAVMAGVLVPQLLRWALTRWAPDRPLTV
ncbi:MFS transporter [Catenulispora subtropica]|uniref:MFS transporter n=1 Tax=Catenulispora subtropica TaxID=450798 RepID=A0ABP5EN50_9ACTN